MDLPRPYVIRESDHRRVSTSAVRVRPRRPEDVPPLAELLAEQQPSSSYPLRWPLPVPVEDFLVRRDEQGAWVAEGDGGLLGHVAVAWVGVDPIGLAFREALGREDLGVVEVLFTSLAARGRGVGGLLHDQAVGWIRAQGRAPVLDVVPSHAAALAVYRHRGWREVGTIHVDWLRDDLILMTLPDG